MNPNPNVVKTYTFIADYIKREGYAPTYLEMAVATGFDPTTITRHIDILESEGHIIRLPKKWRGLRLP